MVRALAGMVAAVAIAGAGRARADVTPPEGESFRSWSQRCVARFVEAARSEPLLAHGTVRPGDMSVVSYGLGDQPEVLSAYTSRESEPIEREWAEVDSHAARALFLERHGGGRIATLKAVKGARPELVRAFVRAFKPALDDCLAMNGSPGWLAPGRYHVEGAVAADGCGGKIVLAAQNIVVGQRILVADVVNRTYALRREGDRLVAEGGFGEQGRNACSGANLREVWELRRRGDGDLEGTLRSSWFLAPACDRECTVEFTLRGRRVAK